MARLTEIVQRIREEGTETKEQGDEKIFILNTISSTLKGLSASVVSIRMFMFEQAAQNKNNFDRMLNRSREAELEAKKTQSFTASAQKENSSNNNIAMDPAVLLGTLATSLVPAVLLWTTGFDNIIEAFKRLKEIGSLLKSSAISLTDSIRSSKIFTNITKAFESLKTVFGAYILKPLEYVITLVRGGIGGVIGNISKAVVAVYDSMSKWLSKLKLVGVFASALKKLPFLNVIFGVLDFFKGFAKGFEEDGVLAGVKEGIFEVIRGIVMKPLDLVKDVASYLADKLGFGDFAKKYLDSWSFEDTFNKFIVPALDMLTKNVFTVIAGQITAIKMLFFEGDVIGAFKQALGSYHSFVTNTGEWFYNNMIKPIATWFFGEEIVKTTEESFKKLFGNAIEIFTNFGNWFYETLIKPVTDWFFGKLIVDPEKAFVELGKESLRIITDFGGWLYDNSIKPTIDWLTNKLLNMVSTEATAGPNRGLLDQTSVNLQSIFNGITSIMNFPSSVYEKAIKPIAEYVASWVPEDGIVAAIQSKMPDWMKSMFNDFPQWLFDTVFTPIANFFNDTFGDASEKLQRKTTAGNARGGDRTPIETGREQGLKVPEDTSKILDKNKMITSSSAYSGWRRQAPTVIISPGAGRSGMMSPMPAPAAPSVIQLNSSPGTSGYKDADMPGISMWNAM